MSSCEGDRPAPLRCPTFPEVLESALAHLPRGRAWQSNEGGPQRGLEIGFEPNGYLPSGFSTEYRPASVLRQFWSAVADVFTFVNKRICDLRLEFWCATHVETHDLWMTEYGLPDACDPFPDLCTKVAAIGGSRCEYYQYIAARAGWSLTCIEINNQCGSRARGRRALAGRMRAGRNRGAIVAIVVDIGNSPAYGGSHQSRPMAGRMLAGRRLSCGPDLGPLECLLGRVVHAEIKISYEVENVV